MKFQHFLSLNTFLNLKQTKQKLKTKLTDDLMLMKHLFKNIFQINWLEFLNILLSNSGREIKHSDKINVEFHFFSKLCRLLGNTPNSVIGKFIFNNYSIYLIIL